MEQLGEQLFFPCVWADRGCLEMLAFNQRAAHEDVCPLNTCPHRHQYACTWQGADVLGHMMDHPSTTLVTKANDVWTFRATAALLRQTAPATFLLQCADHLLVVTTHCFVSAVARGERKISHYAIVAQLIGSQQTANDYAVQVLASGNRTVLTYTGLLKNGVITRSEMLEKCYCLILHHSLAMEMMVGQGALEVEVKLIRLP
ncbi:E3 ubiquitin-protein ligase SIAH1 [Aphelenchoides avenae]|nr:E3 ubiquitin-protein ligase SIAH1 [Aphelenchus avenae]